MISRRPGTSQVSRGGFPLITRAAWERRLGSAVQGSRRRDGNLDQ